MLDLNLFLGFVGGVVAVLGAVFTAYRLLGHSIHRELDRQDQRINSLETESDSRYREVTSRLERETTQRHQNEREAQDGRASLSMRILLLESELRRLSDKGQDE